MTTYIEINQLIPSSKTCLPPFYDIIIYPQLKMKPIILETQNL